MNYQEIIVGFFYSILFSILGMYLKRKMSTKTTDKYFMPGLVLKMLGGLSVGLVYYLYYKGGDTICYYTFGGQQIFKAFLVSPSIAFSLIFGDNVVTPENYIYVKQIWVFTDDASYFVVRITALCNLFAFNTYSGTAIIFSFLSFICIWKLFSFLVNLYPDIHKEIAISFLFLPSLFFWGSGILKDTITFAFLCVFIRAALVIYYYKKSFLKQICILLIASLFIAKIKIYILISIIPALAYLFLYVPIKAIKNPVLKMVITPFAIALALFIGFLGMKKIGESSSKYNLNNISKTAEETARWIHFSSESSGGSSYSLGDYDFTTAGMLKKSIPAIWVTIFRPHPWEVRNPIMLLSSLEALFFIWLLYKGLFMKWSYTKRAMSSTILITFCIIFSLIFSWSVGLTTYNFGTLVRYKIPMMPFFALSMYLLKRNKDILYAHDAEKKRVI